MRARTILLSLAGLLVGSIVGCAAAAVLPGDYELAFSEFGEQASLTVMDNRVILEYEDEDGSAYVEYEVVDRGCRVPP